MTLKEAQSFVDQHHRHNVAPQGHKFSIGLSDGENVVGVVIVGRPVARHNDDGWTLEVTRCCVLEGHKNANSQLYAAAWRATRAMGYNRLITYTLVSESGSSLKAAGWKVLGAVKGREKGWNTPSRPRVKADRYPTDDKALWEIS